MESEVTVLFAADNTAQFNHIFKFLERSGLILIKVSTTPQALECTDRYPVDIIIATVSSSHLNGRDLVRRLRKNNNWIPIILITDVHEPGERAVALDEGADDFLNLPFEPQELVSRIRAVLRRFRNGHKLESEASLLSSHNMTLDRLGRRVLLNQAEVVLTPRAISLLEYLMLHPNQILSRSTLLDKLWNWDDESSIRAVDARIAELRKVLEDSKAAPKFIETVLGYGYRFIGPVNKREHGVK